jgi:propionyl-CoA synthetase
LQDQVAVYA